MSAPCNVIVTKVCISGAFPRFPNVHGNDNLTYGHFVTSFDNGHRFQNARSSPHHSMNQLAPLNCSAMSCLTTTAKEIATFIGMPYYPDRQRSLRRLGRSCQTSLVFDVVSRCSLSRFRRLPGANGGGTPRTGLHSYEVRGNTTYDTVKDIGLSGENRSG